MCQIKYFLSHLHLLINVTAVVNATKISDKVLNFHPLLRLEAGRVEVGVKEDDGEGKNEYRVRGVQFTEMNSFMPLLSNPLWMKSQIY